jgi:hypothetical protein
MAVMPVEWGKIREYAVATANGRAEYLDDPRAPIPPTFLTTVVFWETLGDVFELPEAVAALARCGIERDVRTLLSLEQEYVFHGELPRAGDVLTTSLRFDGTEEKHGRSGRMLLMRFAVEFRGDEDALRAEDRYTSAYLDTPGRAS